MYNDDQITIHIFGSFDSGNLKQQLYTNMSHIILTKFMMDFDNFHLANEDLKGRLLTVEHIKSKRKGMRRSTHQLKSTLLLIGY